MTGSLLEWKPETSKILHYLHLQRREPTHEPILIQRHTDEVQRRSPIASDPPLISIPFIFQRFTDSH